MAESTEQQLPGGLLYSLPSPSPSSASSTVGSGLPHPRSKPLTIGSAKEDFARRYIDGRLMMISRRYVKKYQPVEAGDAAKGYVGFGEVAKDLGHVLDVVWLSGTPSLQIPYLLNIALAVTTYVTAFPFSPKGTFAVLGKLDHAFSSLLKGEDSVSGETLPGFAGGRKAGLSCTDMVRCKGLVEATRVLLVDVMGRAEDGGRAEEARDERETEENETETETDVDEGGYREDWEEVTGGPWEMEVARVYEMTIVQLGELLGEEFAIPGAGNDV